MRSFDCDEPTIAASYRKCDGKDIPEIVAIQYYK